MTRTHWCGEDIVTTDTTLALLPDVLPTFERKPFGRNRLRDVILRPSIVGAPPVPVGVVSKNYVLVQHAAAVRAVTSHVAETGIDAEHVPVRLLISEYGTRMAMRATLPEEHSVVPDDGHRMALTIECFNSVDGSVPLFATVGWFRFVCSNGLVIGNPTAKVRQKHSPALDLDEISGVLADGVIAATQDAKTFASWRARQVSLSELVKWVDGPVADAWGPLAAARVHGIATTGKDGKPMPPRPGAAPHAWLLADGKPVPGTEAPCADAYDLAQILAWIAARRGNVAQRLEWRGQIQRLMSWLVPLRS
jgi:hypothetical protein